MMEAMQNSQSHEESSQHAAGGRTLHDLTAIGMRSSSEAGFRFTRLLLSTLSSLWSHMVGGLPAPR